MSLESGVVQLRNTLIARNAYGPGGAPLPQTNGLPPAPDGQGSDLFGQFTSQGYNLIGKVDGSTGVAAGTNGDQAGSASEPIDPLLGPLAENGGRTPTHSLLPGSPAIDSGKSFGRRKDQRGSQRPYDFKTTPKAPGGDKADIGSFELHPYD